MFLGVLKFIKIGLSFIPQGILSTIEIERNDESFIFVLEKEQDSSLKLYLYPTCINQFQANLASSYRERAILSKMESLCKDLGSKLKCFSNYALLEIFKTA
jgi:poly-gamma-glutamate synthesis protein (capsule biosynthesis protein)